MSEIFKHAGEDFFYVLKGHITFIVGKKEHTLGPGQTIHYKATIRHGWRNDSKEEVHLISVNSMALF